MASLYRFERLIRTYRPGEVEIRALDGIDLEIEEGELLVLLGPSGSGKSTFLDIAGALDLPSEGSVRFRDTELSRLSERGRTLFRRRHVGFVFQFYNLVPSLTAREKVRVVTEIAERPMAPEEALERVGLAARLDHFPSQLSGGEQQRVAIARAIPQRPEVLLADEPTGALDSRTGIRVLEALVHVREQLGATGVIVTHNIAIAAIADRVVHFADGRISRIERNARPAAPRDVSW